MARGKSASKTYCERQDFGMPVDQFVAALDAPMRALVGSLRAIIRPAAFARWVKRAAAINLAAAEK